MKLIINIYFFYFLLNRKIQDWSLSLAMAHHVHWYTYSMENVTHFWNSLDSKFKINTFLRNSAVVKNSILLLHHSPMIRVTDLSSRLEYHNVWLFTISPASTIIDGLIYRPIHRCHRICIMSGIATDLKCRNTYIYI